MNVLHIGRDDWGQPTIQFLRDGKPTDDVLDRPFIVTGEDSDLIRHLAKAWADRESRWLAATTPQTWGNQTAPLKQKGGQR